MKYQNFFRKWKESFCSILFTKEYAKANIPKDGKKLLGLTISEGETDHTFLLIVGLLLTFGLIMLFSAGSARAFANFEDSFWYIKKQLVGALIGGGAMFLTSKIDYHELGRWATAALLGSAFLLLLVIIPGVGTTTNGATRWLFGFQPSEIAKVAIILFYSISITKNHKLLDNFIFGFIPYMLILLVFVVLLGLEPHFSCILLIGFTAVVLLFAAGVKFRHFLIAGVPAFIGLAIYAVSDPYRIARFVSFLDPFADKQKAGYQVVQSLYAIGSGGIFGVGLGQSRQKYQALPEPQNDFIFSVLSEELGLVGAVILIALFMWMIYQGYQIAKKAPDMFGSLLVTGIISLVGIQALMNIAVVTAFAPATGMPLPFFSFGSTALVITMAEMGIVLNVSRQSKHRL